MSVYEDKISHLVIWKPKKQKSTIITGLYADCGPAVIKILEEITNTVIISSPESCVIKQFITTRFF